MATPRKLRPKDNRNRYGFPLLPYLDPEFNPDHPLHHLPPVDDEHFPLGPRLKRQLENEALEKAMLTYTPPHVFRSWENSPAQAKHRERLLKMFLPPKTDFDKYDLRAYGGPHDSSITRRLNQELMTRDPLDFRNFAAVFLHLGYNRFHAYGEDFEETAFLTEGVDPLPEEVCWIMEYTEPECNTIRRRIAHGMGIFPAVTDPNNELYDDEIASRYDRRLYARCRRRTKQCVRPSHIEIFTSSFDALP